MKSKLPEKTNYRFCGNGLGVPGLAHELTRAEAEAQGVLELLEACIEIGVYSESAGLETVESTPGFDRLKPTTRPAKSK
jgi:hypothetical protein